VTDVRATSRDPDGPEQAHEETGHSTAGAALDLLLAEAGQRLHRRFLPPGRSLIRLVGRLARQPRTLVRRAGDLTGDVTTIVRGASERQPAKRDRRFADPAWNTNWLLRRLLQTYLTLEDAVYQLIDDAGLDWDDDTKLRFVTENLFDAIAPTNFPLSNPAVLKAAVDERGRNFIRGASNFVADIRTKPRLPANVDASRFKIGENLALSPGAVVLRDERFELIQYQPRTEEVRGIPLVIVPPMINKFYIMDLAPGRSLIEYLVERGQQVFSMSWRNPDQRYADWGLDAYAGATLEALAVTSEITGAEKVNIVGNCAGGMLVSTIAAHLARAGVLEDRVASITLGVTVLDNERSNVLQTFAGPNLIGLATRASERKGYLDGSDLASVFLWLRPNDLIWPYVVNNWLLGKQPPAFDILYWNDDTTRMPARLHKELIEIASRNLLRTPNAVRVLGSPVDFSRVTVDSYIVAGISDHISPWQNCYRTTQLLGGRKRFVLSTSGHIAAIVNPPGNKRASFRTADGDTPAASEDWLDKATVQPGTWWEDWDQWLAEHSGETRPAPQRLGSSGHPVLGDAPGEYVHE
jgi:polyhydroxyalkanoate synthase